MPYQYQKHHIPVGDAGSFSTVSHMLRLIDKGTENPIIRRQAAEIVKQCPSKDKMCELKAVFHWVKSNVRFTADPRGKELLHTAETVLNNRAGDCDDHVVLNAALLQSVGYPVRIVLIASKPEMKDRYSHVYMQAQNPYTGKWYGFDTSIPRSTFGWEPPRAYRKTHVPVR